MSNKRKCCFLIILLLTLFYTNGAAQRISFQSRPSIFQANDEYTAYQPFKSDQSQSIGNHVQNRPSTATSNAGSYFPASNSQNGFQSDLDFGSSRRDENDRRDWDYEKNTDRQRGNKWSSSQNGPKTDGFGSSLTQQPKKNSGFGGSTNWNTGFQNAGSDNQMNGNSYTSFNSNSKKTQGFNTNSNWNSGFQKKDPGVAEHQPKKKPGQNWSTNSNNWNSGFNNEKEHGGTQTGTNAWKSDDSKTFVSQFNPFQTNLLKPASSNTTPKPDKATKPPKGSGYDKIPTQKPAANVDWANLEKENKKGPLVLDLSQLWYANDTKNSNQNAMKSKKRNVLANHLYDCYCTGYDDCDPDRRLDGIDVFGSDYFHLRSKASECADQNKVCCLTSPRATTEKRRQLAKYETEGTNLRPSCGKRTSKLTPDDKTDEGLANYGDFPWMLRLIEVSENSEDVKNLCSASLIHSSVALTTASCALLLSGENIRARAGEWNLGTGHERNKLQEAKIGKVFLHPEFDFVSYSKDLALIILDQAFDYRMGSNSVCLPSPNDAWDSSRCVVSGWFEDTRRGTEKPLLLKVDLAAVARGRCGNYSEYETNETGMEDPRYICATARSGNPCVADAGALLCPLYNSDMLVLVGFLSRSGICNEFYKTGTFTDITESIDWITHMEGIYLYFHNRQLQQ